MKVKLKMLGLALIALMALDALAIVASAVKNPADLSDAFGIGFAALSAYVGTLAVSRIGAATDRTLSRSSITRRSTRKITLTAADRLTIGNHTVAPQLLSAASTTRLFTNYIDCAASDCGEGRNDQRQNPRYDRIEPTISPVMAY